MTKGRCPFRRCACSPRSSAAGATGEAGFTLVELLVALTMLGLLFSVLAGGLRFGLRLWDSADERTSALTVVQSVSGLLTRTLGQAMPVSADAAGQNRGRVAFAGQADGVSFVAPLPTHLGLGGLNQVTLGLAPGDEGRGRLVMSWQLQHLAPEAAAREGAQKSAVLLDEVAGVTFSYFGPTPDRRAVDWQEQWLDRDVLPALVRVSVKLPEGDARFWPPLTLALMVNGAAACVYDPILKRCR